MEDKIEDPLDPIKNARPEIERIIKRVLTLERDRLYQKQPRVNSDIIQIIKEEIQ